MGDDVDIVAARERGGSPIERDSARPGDPFAVGVSKLACPSKRSSHLHRRRVDVHDPRTAGRTRDDLGRGDAVFVDPDRARGAKASDPQREETGED